MSAPLRSLALLCVAVAATMLSAPLAAADRPDRPDRDEEPGERVGQRDREEERERPAVPAPRTPREAIEPVSPPREERTEESRPARDRAGASRQPSPAPASPGGDTSPAQAPAPARAPAPAPQPAAEHEEPEPAADCPEAAGLEHGEDLRSIEALCSGGDEVPQQQVASTAPTRVPPAGPVALFALVALLVGMAMRSLSAERR